MEEYDKNSVKRNEAKEKKKKMLLTGIVICIILIIVLAFLTLYYQHVDAHTFKLFINDEQVNSSEGFYITDDNGETYVRAKDIAGYIGWSYQNGEYGTFTENSNSGYLQNDYEASSFVAGSKSLKKFIQVANVLTEKEVEEKKKEAESKGEEFNYYLTNSANGTLETATLEFPVISKDGQMYFPLKCLSDICNCRVVYDNPYRMYIYEQNFLIKLAQQKAAEFGYESLSGTYENMRTLGYGMMVVGKNSLFGVVDIYSGSSIIGLKYSDMVFAQNTKEFFVKTNTNDEESVGIINVSGDTVVPPKNYSNIQILSDDLGLYLVEKDGQYGVLDKKGDVIVHCEYDSVGIPEDVLTKFEFSADKNKYLLFDDTLIVQADGKYGIYDTEGTQTLATGFLGLGYLTEDDEGSQKNADNLLTIEIENLELKDGTTRDVRGIVIQQDIDGEVKYGLYDSVSKKLLLQCYYDRIYSKTSKGNTDYYIEFQGQTAKLTEQLAEYPEYFEE